MRKMWNSVSAYATPLATLLVLLAIWQTAARLFDLPSWLLPAPSEIASAFVGRADLWGHTWATLYETLAGFLLSIALGVPIAVAVVYSRFLRDSLYPLILITQSIPKVAFAPILLIWIGYGTVPIVIVSFLVAFWPVIVNTEAGLNSASPEILDLARQLSGTQLQIFTKIRFPSSLPFFLAGLKVAITLSVIGAVIGEFVGASKGLGYIIIWSSSNFKTPLAFAAMGILAAMGIVLFFAISALERVLIPWYGRSS